ncbi:esterase/lipase [Mycolicibacterium phlei]|uniref:Esterase n=1 Tax=Mycolicibacterium phlei DSM 43239 = CCUG 21000 TaxID=1226750 RepID=A0A5N5VC10_MYCPH|nr:alpha/beta hydrolase [Mycolicibacterium phlei]VEG11769.1 esterase/lipase [Mycobacteroides chelonae]AMO63676.1 Carboxylesterase NlhH [Mycolicibacterium phlei]KAB7759494.1 esterase [Mycolicibacterium phlei DSM 43239 = CCUG 21000]KXW60107.1 esterase [Mycolicibacterium phlei DSM 43072]KXW68536.1 esterase [Mycolicibacterium phlei DSM 43239 = CCUG 21000]
MPASDVHPDLRRAARFIPKQLVSPVTLPMLRIATRRLGRHVPRDVEVLTLPSGVGVRLHRPPTAAGPGPALLWIHGGGYVIGHPAQDDEFCRRYARRLGATVAAVNYRLAPENPYPASLEDCYTALKWLAALPGVDRSRVAIGGGSAGGGLAAALALLARDRGEIPLAAQLLVYPMLDDRTVADKPGVRLWNGSSNRFGWRAYLGNADPDIAVPARRTDLSGLPPAWIGVGTLDLFHDEDLAYAERLRAAGVPCEVEVVEGAFHGFDAVAQKAPVSQRFFDSQCAWLQRALSPAAA